MSDSQYNRRIDWEIFDLSTPVYEPAKSLRKRLEQAQFLEKQIEDAAELLIRRAGSLVIVAITEGRNTIPLLQSSELDFIDALPECHSASDISDYHKRILNDMKIVASKLNPILIKSHGMLSHSTVHEIITLVKNGWEFKLTEAN